MNQELQGSVQVWEWESGLVDETGSIVDGKIMLDYSLGKSTSSGCHHGPGRIQKAHHTAMS